MLLIFMLSKNLKKKFFLFRKKNKLILNKNFFIQSYEIIFRSFQIN